MITLYTRTVCPKCMGVKSLLKDNKLEFKTINVDDPSNEKEAEKLREMGFMAAPIMEHDGKFYANLGEINQVINELAE